MTRRFQGALAEERAEAYAATLDDLDPRVGRCGHAKFKIGRRRWRMVEETRGRLAECPCPRANEPDPDCPYVTWRAVPVIRLPNGEVVVPGVGGPDRDLDEQEKDASVAVEPPKRVAARGRPPRVLPPREP